jgi:hypothetical protein
VVTHNSFIVIKEFARPRLASRKSFCDTAPARTSVGRSKAVCFFRLVRPEGIEPSTSVLSGQRSTTELRALVRDKMEACLHFSRATRSKALLKDKAYCAVRTSDSSKNESAMLPCQRSSSVDDLLLEGSMIRKTVPTKTPVRPRAKPKSLFRLRSRQQDRKKAAADRHAIIFKIESPNLSGVYLGPISR